jgi:hypothetical protein
MTRESVMSGSREAGAMVFSPEPMLNVIVSTPELAFASSIA